MKDLRNILEEYKSNNLNTDEAIKLLKEEYYKDLGFAKIDYHREVRVGYPEVIYCEKKTVDQVLKIFAHMLSRNTNILATRASQELFDAINNVYPDASYNSSGKVITLQKQEVEQTTSYIAIIAAGTSDMPVVEEARITAEFFGNQVKTIVDVGVAGIHRLFDKMEVIRNAKVLIVIAGMEGALASVIGGLVNKPVIAVPTSVGYGANFEGLAALLAMLNSCASGISVVNIDNGFGAAFQASMINKL